MHAPKDVGNDKRFSEVIARLPMLPNCFSSFSDDANSLDVAKRHSSAPACPP